MTKSLTSDQISQALGKRATPAPRASSNDYDSSLDEQLEHFLNPANRPPNQYEETSWPPNSGAGAWAVRFRAIRLLGGSEDYLDDLPALLICYRKAESRIVRHNAMRSIVALVVPLEFREKVPGPVLQDCIDAINADPELAGNSLMANGSPDWIGLCSGDRKQV